ncbi:hypothetical protein Tco_0926382 [Tanacetum coccineum]|uniref:Uncharacterized protein n=1 Tax=Tanacetum coccineum TaxID=301880 RepID=A0ABQ5DAF8_9ASTR
MNQPVMKCGRLENFYEAENKRKLNNTSKNNQNQQQPNKRQNTSKAYAVGHGEEEILRGSKTVVFPKCNYHNDGPSGPKCTGANIVGHWSYQGYLHEGLPKARKIQSHREKPNWRTGALESD